MGSAENLATFASKLNTTGNAELFGVSAAVYATAGTFSWTCPEGVTRAKVTAIGGGGNGGASGSGGAVIIEY